MMKSRRTGLEWPRIKFDNDSKLNFKASNFEIRFHLLPNIKVTKLQDDKTVLIELMNSGWRFFSNDGKVGVETGLYFGNKNNYVENQNMFISGITQNIDQLIEWQISKIWIKK